MAVTRSDVARAAGVSPAVVSYVLNNGPRPVAIGTRERVLAAIEQLGYRPNAIASALRGGSTQTIGLLTPNRSNPFYGALAEAIERSLTEQGYLTLTASTYGNRSSEERLLRTFVDRKADGLIITSGVSLSGAPLADVEQPVLVLEERVGNTLSTVSMDDERDAAGAVDHLQVHGHDLIGCIVGPPYVSTDGLRLAGWRDQQHRTGRPAGDGLVAFADAGEEGGYQAAGLLLSEHGRPWAVYGRRPTALFVASDVQAFGALHACWELGLRVPDDVAVVSVGGTRAARFTIPPLTTMRQDVEYLARIACARLLQDIREPGTPPTHVRLTGNLVVGRTCGCTP
ncbi:LacI family DNA-binding transcriptional regulator [Paractinoplanes ferrugineus]|uniref:LacI family transcriptional regulator n=1 Tax=Paractinoplanes ferrugineus TaxID=113564 RepID=A0A919J8G7_9ACTN|nr:LacI family DNA-binding transcriptional regulator [Actinoplanes ferrugineus]GIE16043.1 LacI family transcriptional regulator [Actinoplanes ferrugineus]